MAGRGTDILLGGNSDSLVQAALRDKKEDEIADNQEIEKIRERLKAVTEEEYRQVAEVGGLHIIGTCLLYTSRCV